MKKEPFSFRVLFARHFEHFNVSEAGIGGYGRRAIGFWRFKSDFEGMVQGIGKIATLGLIRELHIRGYTEISEKVRQIRQQTIAAGTHRKFSSDPPKSLKLDPSPF